MTTSLLYKEFTKRTGKFPINDFEYMAQGVEKLYPQIRNLPTA